VFRVLIIDSTTVDFAAVCGKSLTNVAFDQ